MNNEGIRRFVQILIPSITVCETIFEKIKTIAIINKEEAEDNNDSTSELNNSSDEVKED